MNTNQVLQTIWERKIRFIAVFFLIFTVTYAVLYVIDFLPEAPGAEEEASIAIPATARAVEAGEVATLEAVSTQELGEVDVVNEATILEVDENVQTNEVQTVSSQEVVGSSAAVLPTSIYIKKLDKTVQILNPQSRALADLDEALLNGAVRHPDSATLDQEGNVFLLGHSSYLPNVINENFQAFNGIQKLEWGDTIEVTGGDKTYVYRVEKVYKAKASEVTVPIANTGNMLTIATCNSFGSTDDRYIVEATQLIVRSS